MRKNRVNILLLLVILGILAVEIAYTCTRVVTYRPVYMSFEELRDAVKSLPIQALINPGKIMVKDDYIYISERKKGVHIIDNSIPSQPKNVGFINIPGNIDLAMKNNILYADSYVDLVAIDVSDPAAVVETGRIEDIYPNDLLFDDELIAWEEQIDPDRGVVVDKELVSTSENPCGNNGGGFVGCWGATTSGGSYEDAVSAPGGSTGITGSMARITTAMDHLYLLSGSALKAVAIDTPETPELTSSMPVGSDVETVYAYGGSIFIGGRTGVQIIDIATDPANPIKKSSFSHTWQCDPIVVNGDVAYVTLRSGFRCGGGNNQLDILDVSDLTRPTLIKSYPMENPYGLAIDGTTLFLADGYAGLKIFDVADSRAIIKFKQFPGNQVHDVILYNQLAIVVGEGGLYQYRYTISNDKLDDIQLISQIDVESQP